MSDPVQCLTCARMTLRGAPMARHGFGQCALKAASTSVSILRPLECQHHQPAAADIVDKRRAWLKGVQNPAA